MFMTPAGLVPLMRYRDVAAAIEWLRAAFGFEQRAVVADPDGGIAYAELSYGSGLVMLGPVGQSGLDTLLKQPSDLEGANTQSCYVAVGDVEAHIKRARAAGAEIVLEFGANEGSERAYAARDPEGHIWNFGAYVPWHASAAPEPRKLYQPTSRAAKIAHTSLAASVLMMAAASAAGVCMMPPETDSSALTQAPFDSVPTASRSLAPAATPAAQAAAKAADSSMEHERRARTDAQDQAAALRTALDRESYARREGARTAAGLREQLAREQAARAAAEAASTAAKAQLIREREAKLQLKANDRERSAAIAKIEAQETLPNAAATTVPEMTGSLSQDNATSGTTSSSSSPPAQPVTAALPSIAPEPTPAAPAAGSAPAKSKAPPKTVQRKTKPAKAASAKPKKSQLAPGDQFWPYD